MVAVACLVFTAGVVVQKSSERTLQETVMQLQKTIRRLTERVASQQASSGFVSANQGSPTPISTQLTLSESRVSVLESDNIMLRGQVEKDEFLLDELQRENSRLQEEVWFDCLCA